MRLARTRAPAYAVERHDEPGEHGPAVDGGSGRGVLAGGFVGGLLVGLLAVLALGFALGSGRFFGVSDEEKALAVLRADHRDVTALGSEMRRSERVADLRAAGRRAEKSVVAIRARGAALAAIDDPEVRTTADTVHSAMLALARGTEQLKDVDQQHLNAWDDSEREMIDAIGGLDASASTVARYDREQPLTIDPDTLERPVATVSSYLTSSAKKLARWQKKMVKFRRRNRAKLQAASSYRNAVQAQIAAYSGTRRELQKYIDDVRDFDDKIHDFRDELETARSKRQSIKSSLSALTPPPSVAAAQQGLLSVLDLALSGTDAGIKLADATQDLRDEGDGSSGFELPEYDEFKRISDDVTSRFAAASAAWNTAIDKHIHRLRHPKGAPRKPRI